MQNIEFKTKDNLTLRGWFFIPAKTPAPAIIMTHGFSALKEHGLQPFAEYFLKLGFCVLVYDHRNFGESDGKIRSEVDPEYQVKDMQSAISFLEAHPLVNHDKIGLWGASFSGGIVLSVASIDPRLSVAVLNVPFISGHHAVLQEKNPELYEALLKKYAMDAKNRCSGKSPMMTPVVTHDPEKSAVMKESSAYAFFTRVSHWENTVTLRSVQNAGNFRLFSIENITLPLLFIVAENDTLCPTTLALQAYQTIRSEKKLVMIKGDHFAPFGDAFFVCREEAGHWFLQFLR